MASVLEPIVFDPAAFRQELTAFETLLNSKADLAERADIQPFFKASKHLTAYIGTLGFGVFETRDGGRHWTNVSDGLRSSTNAMIVLSLAYAPSQHTLYAGTSTGVYRLATSTPFER